MQIYQGLDISTNKPSQDELRLVPHHMISCLPKEKEYSCQDFAIDASKIITDITNRGNLPILAGGSNLYIQFLLFTKDKLRYDVRFVYLDCEISDLELHLKTRILKMIDRGMLEEFTSFHQSIEGIEKPEDTFQIAQSIGYKEFQPWIIKPKQEILDECIDKLVIATRNYARKQITWFYGRWACQQSQLVPNHLFKIPFHDDLKVPICMEIVKSLISGDKMSEKAIKYQVTDPLFIKDVEFKDHYCEFCSKTLHGENEWKIHLKSKSHHHFKKLFYNLKTFDMSSSVDDIHVNKEN